MFFFPSWYELLPTKGILPCPKWVYYISKHDFLPLVFCLSRWFYASPISRLTFKSSFASEVDFLLLSYFFLSPKGMRLLPKWLFASQIDFRLPMRFLRPRWSINFSRWSFASQCVFCLLRGFVDSEVYVLLGNFIFCLSRWFFSSQSDF